MISSAALLALGILSSSFFGSWHCAGMCGPVASLMATRKSLFTYHLGRLCSYSLLGVSGGFLGQFFLRTDFAYLRWTSAFLFAAVLIASGLNILFPSQWGQKFNTHLPTARLFALIKRLQAFHISHSGFIVGLLTALLPCGWLYTYVAAAIATQSPWSGALIMALFWLGGLPALSALPMMVRRIISSAGPRQQKTAGLILVVAGIYSLSVFIWMHSA